MTVTVFLTKALICFMGQCYPMLSGLDTPTGSYNLSLHSTQAAGYGGNVLVFTQKENDIYAIHRVLNIPGQQRPERLKSNDPADRATITAGCINVDPAVYDKLMDCCSNSQLIIK